MQQKEQAMMQATQAVRLPVYLIEDAKKYADLEFRSVPKQVEYFYNLGKIAKDNPDLPMDFIIDVLESRNEPSTPFEFRTK
jgi:hypothetical protein